MQQRYYSLNLKSMFLYLKNFTFLESTFTIISYNLIESFYNKISTFNFSVYDDSSICLSMLTMLAVCTTAKGSQPSVCTFQGYIVPLSDIQRTSMVGETSCNMPLNKKKHIKMF